MLDGLTPTHLILVLVVALIVLGPGKLPEAGAALGKAIRGFREAASGSDDPPVPPQTPTTPPQTPTTPPPTPPTA